MTNRTKTRRAASRRAYALVVAASAAAIVSTSASAQDQGGSSGGSTSSSTTSGQAAGSAESGGLGQAPSPYYIGASETVSHDSNVFRVPNGPSDTFSTTSLLGGFDQQISRQRFHGNATVGLSRYRNETNLNNTNYGVNAGWDWQTIEKLSGTVSASLTQALASMNDNSTAITTARNMVKTQQYGFTGRYGGDSLLSLEGALSHSKVTYSEVTSNDANSDSASFGVYYRPGATLRLGTAVRYSDTESPQGVRQVDGTLGSNTEKGHYLDLTADWRPTVLTTVAGRVSWTRQTNTAVTARDFSGVTGFLSGRWQATGKLVLNTTLSRDAGVNGNFFTLNTTPTTTPQQGQQTTQPVTGLSESSQVTNSVSFGANYAATAKISVAANAALRYGRLVDTVTAGGSSSTDERHDNSRHYTIGVNYAAARFWQLGCQFQRFTRDLEASALNAGISYSSNLTSCTAQFTLQ
ncbi:MAG TPA: hypothetical protein VJO99_17085 [Burkholderiaceae bacterium]|nr:hypothetical protein [Burkholderiaceae bacterium]